MKFWPKNRACIFFNEDNQECILAFRLKSKKCIWSICWTYTASKRQARKIIKWLEAMT